MKNIYRVGLSVVAFALLIAPVGNQLALAEDHAPPTVQKTVDYAKTASIDYFTDTNHGFTPAHTDPLAGAPADSSVAKAIPNTRNIVAKLMTNHYSMYMTHTAGVLNRAAGWTMKANQNVNTDTANLAALPTSALSEGGGLVLLL